MELMPHLRVRHFAVGIQSPTRLHEVVKVSWGTREVELVVSPTGRSAQVYIDGKKAEVANA